MIKYDDYSTRYEVISSEVLETKYIENLNEMQNQIPEWWHFYSTIPDKNDYMISGAPQGHDIIQIKFEGDNKNGGTFTRILHRRVKVEKPVKKSKKKKR